MSVIGALAIGVTLQWQFTICVGVFAQFFCLLKPGSKRAETIWRACGWMHQELWIAVPPGMLLATIQNWHGHTPWLVVFNAWSLYQWWTLRNWPDDENRWKRRGRKLKDAVAERAGRLVVVPS